MPRRKGGTAKQEGPATEDGRPTTPAAATAPTPEPTPTPTETDPLEGLKKKNEELAREMLYLRADIDNTRKRLSKEAEQRVVAAREQVVRRFLDVLDNFDRALAVQPKGDEARAFVNGVCLIRAQMQQVLEAQGVRPITTKGAAFDPSLHEAVETVSLDDKDDKAIVEEVLKGYTINGKVLRPAKVKVNMRRRKEEKAENEEKAGKAEAKEGEKQEDGTCGCHKI